VFHLLRALAILAVLARAPAVDDETAQYIASMKERLADDSIDVDSRESLVLEAAATLDRAARAEPSLVGKLARWDAAIELLDDFDRKIEDHPRRREFGLQAAVYRWAQARAWNDQRAVRPAEVPTPQREAAALDDSIARLRRIVGGEAGALSDNVRFRLAWSLTDRAALDPAGSPMARHRRDEALGFLKDPPTEAALAGFHALLKAELLRESGEIQEAAAQVAAAARAQPPPPEAEILDVLLPILIDRRAFAEARKAIDAMALPAPAKALQHARVDLGEWKAAAPGPAGSTARRAMEDDLLKRIGELKAARAPETRIVLSELAASKPAPDPDASRDFWDALAEGHEIRGDPAAAAAASENAAARAERDGRHAEAAESRLRAAGFLFQAGRYTEAGAPLEKILADPQAGPSRPRASLLLALARGREAAGAVDARADRYEQALSRHLKDFPDDPTSIEARWMLGSLEQARGRREQALELWKAVPPESPRWIQARVAACETMRRALESRVAAEEREGLEADFQAARTFIDETIEMARGRPDSDRAELLIAQARLNLTPIVGRPPLAREESERCLAMSLTPSLRYRARLVRMVATAADGRYLEAEREAQQHPGWAAPDERAALVDAVRQLDLSAASAETDLPQRRFAQVARTLITPLLQSTDLPDDLRNELTFRLARAQLFQGDSRGARATLQDWAPSTERADDRYLRDLADAYSRLDANSLAIDVQRLRIQRLKPGSRPWLDARYGLALAYYRMGRNKDAAQLVEATSILHPELGGGRLREKFIRLRQRLGSAP
jgi:tetratricopeptide (TPR) repeat protein